MRGKVIIITNPLLAKEFASELFFREISSVFKTVSNAVLYP